MSLYKEMHRVNQFLTLYLQRKAETQAVFGAPTYPGRLLLPTLLPSDEYSGVDFTEVAHLAGVNTTWTEDFISPYLFKDRVKVKGSGLACLRFSTFTDVAGGTITLNSVNIQLRREILTGIAIALIDTLISTLATPWANTSLAETRRSFVLALNNLDFELNPSERLLVSAGCNITTAVQAGHSRLLYTRGVADSYIMLPVEES